MDGAGLEADFNNEVHEMNLVWNQVRRNKLFIMEALDKDVASSDFLGAALPISYNVLTQSTDLIQHDLEIYDENYHHSGYVKFTTQLIWRDADPIPKSLNKRSFITITIIKADFLKNSDWFGK
jgi:hypothetical protein